MHRKQPSRARIIREIIGMALIGLVAIGPLLATVFLGWWQTIPFVYGSAAIAWFGHQLATAPEMTDPEFYGTEYDPDPSHRPGAVPFEIRNTDITDEGAFIPVPPSVPAFEAADPEPSREPQRD